MDSQRFSGNIGPERIGNMVKKLLLLLMTLALLTMAGCKKRTEEVQTHTEETTVPAATEITEITSPGLEDSEFDEEPAETTVPAEETEPEQDDVPQNTTEPEKTEETEPKKPETKPTAPPTEPAEVPGETEGGSAGAVVTDYESFLAMSPEEQQKYVESFESIDQFFAWYNAAKEEYEAANPPIDVGDGNIDIGDIIEGKG